jgi:hypothetical protein
LDGQSASRLLHGLLSLGERLNHLGIRYSLCPFDESSYVVAGDPSPGSGCFGPAVHSTVEHRRHVVGAVEGLSGHQVWQGTVDIETMGFGLSERRQQRSEGVAGLNRFEFDLAEP